MHIRRLARNAAFIAVAATVTGGFATGIAQATSVTPTSTVSSVPSVTSGGTAPRMPQGCTKVCTFDVGIRGLVLLQQWPCTPALHSGITNPVFEVVNNCSTRVWTHAEPPKPVCISPHSAKSGVGRFGTVSNVQVVTATSNCPAGSG
jgi:hypothetical protein